MTAQLSTKPAGTQIYFFCPSQCWKNAFTLVKMAVPVKDPINAVHQNAILCETIMKEQRHQKIYTSYGVNPFKKSEYHLLSPTWATTFWDILGINKFNNTVTVSHSVAVSD